MAKMTEDHKRKRQRKGDTVHESSLGGSDRKVSHEQGKQGAQQDDPVLKVLEAAEDGPLMVKPERMLRPRSVSGKESNMDEQGKRTLESDEHRSKAVDSLMSLHHLQDSDRNTNMTNNDDTNLKLMLKSAMGSLDDAEGPGQQMSSSQEQDSIENLKAFIQKYGGELEDGWQVEIQRRSGTSKVTKLFISPAQEKFRSRLEVARHLGLLGNTKKHSGNTSRIQAQGGQPQATLSNGKVVNKGTKIGENETDNSSVPTFQTSYSQGPNIQTGQEIADGKKGADNLHVARKEPPEADMVSQRCQDVLRSIISAEKFGALSHLLNRGSSSGVLEAAFQNKTPTFSGSLDLQLIYLRLSTGAYGKKPEMFSADVQQVWKNVSSVGNELVTLATYLSELSNDLYSKQVMSLFQVESEEKAFPSTANPIIHIPEQETEAPPDKGDTVEKRRSHSNRRSKTEPQGAPYKGEAEKVNKPGSEPEAVVSEDLSGQGRVTLQAVETSSQEFSSPAKKPATILKGKKTNEHNKRIRSEGAQDDPAESACKTCGLKAGMADHIVCMLCNAKFHTYCAASRSNSLPSAKWICSACSATSGNEDICTGTRSSDDVEAFTLMFKQGNQQASEITKDLQDSRKQVVCALCEKDDDDLLLCDSCEIAYHLACLNPPIDTAPDGCWYCPTCAEKTPEVSLEIEHADEGQGCTPSSDRPDAEKSLAPVEDESPEQDDGNSSAEVPLSPEHPAVSEPQEPVVANELPEHAFILKDEDGCKVCGERGKKIIINCSACDKRYHLSCLRPSLKKVPRGTWYCPSCLCRVCQKDENDDSILLCDGCDEGYHTYCLRPPLKRVPEGTWFCPSCEEQKGHPLEVSATPGNDQLSQSQKLPSEVSKRKRKSTEPRRST